MPETLVCWACEEPVDRRDQFCRYCGAEFTDSPPQKRRRKWPWIVLGLGLALWMLL